MDLDVALERARSTYALKNELVGLIGVENFQIPLKASGKELDHILMHHELLKRLNEDMKVIVNILQTNYNYDFYVEEGIKAVNA